MTKGLCRTSTKLALQLHHELANGNCSTSTAKIKPDDVCYNTIIDGLCKDGQVGKGNAKELFMEMKCKGFSPCVIVYDSLMAYVAQMDVKRLKVSSK